MSLIGWLLRAQRWHRNVRAVLKGRVARRIRNRAVTRSTGLLRRRFWK